MAIPRTSLTVVLAAGEGTRMRSRAEGAAPDRRPIAARARARGGAAGRPRPRSPSWSGPTRDAVAAEARHVRSRRGNLRPGGAARHRACACSPPRTAIARGPDDVLVIFGDTPLIRAADARRLRGASPTAQRSRCSASGRAIPPATAA